MNGPALTSLAPFGAAALGLLQDGSTPLHMAAQSGRLEVVRELLRAGAALDAVDHVRPPHDG
jgi:ankyrin repeat protein